MTDIVIPISKGISLDVVWCFSCLIFVSLIDPYHLFFLVVDKVEVCETQRAYTATVVYQILFVYGILLARPYIQQHHLWEFLLFHCIQKLEHYNFLAALSLADLALGFSLHSSSLGCIIFLEIGDHFLSFNIMFKLSTS